MFLLELEPRPHADRRIGHHLEECPLTCLVLDQRGIMPCIAELQMAGLQIRQSEEHRDKHALLVVLHQSGVHTSGNLSRHHAL